MKRRLAARALLPPILALALWVTAPAAGASGLREAIAGTWRMDVDRLLAHGLVYFIINPDSSCQQVIRIRTFGFTKWIARSCTWQLDGNALTLQLRKSNSPKEETETTSRITLAEVTDSSLVVAGEGEQQRWARAAELPVEFREHLQTDSSR